ncbi:MAG: PQQ-like beta-propeller repeat protein [Sedimentisphaerales bacterium]|nr:PQQ-like beta-propeller repeat protein [Sedimentisphaerales bacterium]
MKWKLILMALVVSPVVLADILYTSYIDANTGYLYRYDDSMNLIWQSTNQRGIDRFTVSPINGNIYAGYDGTDKWVRQFDVNTGVLIATTVPTISGLSSNHVNDVAFGYDWNLDGVPDLWIVTRTSLLVFNGAQTVGTGTATELARWTIADSTTTVYDGTGGTAILFGPDITGDGVEELYVGKGGNNAYGKINVYNIAASTVDTLVKAATYAANNTRDIGSMLWGPDVFGDDGFLDLVSVSSRNYQLRCFNFQNGTDMGIIEENMTSKYYPLCLAVMPNGSFLMGTRMKTELDPLWVSGVETGGGNLVRLDPVPGTSPQAYTPTLLMLSPRGGTSDYRFTDVMYFEQKAAYAPIPASGKKVALDLAQTSWTNPDPNQPGGQVTCDVWFTLNYPEYLPFPDPNLLKISDPNDRASWWLENPNFEMYATKVIDNQPINTLNLSTVTTVPLTYGQTYYWRVDTRDTSNPEAGTTIGPVWLFTADNSAPQVDAGQTVYTWLTNGTVDVTMAPTISDDGRPNPPGAYTVLWEEVVDDPDVTINNPTVQAATVTITKTGSYTLKLTVDDSQLTNAATVTVNVYMDACSAAKGVPGYAKDPGDFDNDCDVDLDDFLQLAADWLHSTALAAPLP